MLLLPTLALAQAEHQVDLGWNVVTGVEGYNVYWGLQSRIATAYPNSYPLDLADTNLDCTQDRNSDGILDCSYILRNLTPNTEVFMAVQAYNSAGNSGFSREIRCWPEPDVNAIPTDCTPVPGGGADCVAHVQGNNMSPSVTATIPYPGVTVNTVTRIDSQNIDIAFTIDASAAGGNADLIMRNPWDTTQGTELPGETGPTSGMAGDLFQGALTIVPVVLPDAPFNFQRIEL